MRAAPANAEASFDLARAASERGDFATAIAALERILIINPTLDNIRLELGVLYLRLGATAAAEELIRAALRSPGAPPEVRARAEELLAAAVEGNARLRVAGSVTLGLATDSNANAGPASGALGPDFDIKPEDTGQPDLSVLVSAAAQARYDLGLQAGHLLAFDASLYGRRFQDLSDLDQVSLAVAPGLDLNLSRSLGRPADLLVRYELNALRLGGEDYLREHGPSATLRFAAGGRAEVELAVQSLRQDYRATADQGANDDRDGRRDSVDVSTSLALSPTASLSFGAGLTRKTAEEGFEAYDERYLSVGYRRAVEVAAIPAGPLVLGFDVQRSLRDYDEADERIDPANAQSDRVWSLSASVAVPLSERSSLLAEVGHVEQDSNYAIDRYDNTYGLVAVTFAF